MRRKKRIWKRIHRCRDSRVIVHSERSGEGENEIELVGRWGDACLLFPVSRIEGGGE
jgi:hypothetical protein